MHCVFFVVGSLCFFLIRVECTHQPSAMGVDEENWLSVAVVFVLGHLRYLSVSAVCRNAASIRDF